MSSFKKLTLLVLTLALAFSANCAVANDYLYSNDSYGTVSSLPVPLPRPADTGMYGGGYVSTLPTPIPYPDLYFYYIWC